MMTVARATDTEVFLAFLEQVLLPALKECKGRMKFGSPALCVMPVITNARDEHMR